MLAVPITSCIMETQILVLFLATIMLFFARTPEIWPLDEVSILFLLLGLQWWAMFVSFIQLRGNGGRPGFLRLLGLVLAIAALIGTHLALLADIPTLLFAIILVVGLWWRGVDRSREGMAEERLIMAFKIGFAVVLGVLIFSALGSSFALLVPLLVRSLPLFFFSGLVALSFNRLGVIMRENSRHPGVAQTAAIRKWLFFLTLVWVIIVGIALGLELFSFQFIQRILQPLWSLLGAIVSFILYLLSLLFSGLAALFGPQRGTPALRTLQPPAQAAPRVLKPSAPISPEYTLIAQIVLLIIVVVILAFVIRMVLKTWQRTHGDDDGDDEIREGLSARDIRQARRKEREQHNTNLVNLEDLDPASARARYREFLQKMALSENDLARRPAETPTEYQARIYALVEKMSDQSLPSDEPANTTVLRELTRAYIQERYQGKHLEPDEHAYLNRWLPAFLQRLTAGKTVDNTSR